MEDYKQQISNFIVKCDDLIETKFILADTKITELLKAIASSELLYGLFEEVTKDFNYTETKKECMKMSPNGSVNKKVIYLPEEANKKLAFIFCLLVEFDNKSIDFNTFLQEYFYEDGSYFESFSSFTNQLIKPLKNIIKTLFKDQLVFDGNDITENKVETQKLSIDETLLKRLNEQLVLEKNELLTSNLKANYKADGIVLLEEMLNLVAMSEKIQLNSILIGYKYFVEYTKYNSKHIALIQKLIKE